MRIWLALWTVFIVWGSTYLAIRYMVETVPALLGSGVRFFLAGSIFALWLIVRRGGFPAMRVSRAELASCAFVGTALLFGGNGLVSVAEDAGTPSGLTALVVASVPLWVVLFRRLAGDRVGRSTLLWVLLGFLGVAAAFCWATGSFWSSRLRLPRDPIRSTSWQMLCGGLAMSVGGLLAGEA